jgi:hypothetical protein
MALGLLFLPNPGFLLIVQLHAQLRLSDRILRSTMLQQPPRHRPEHMKESDYDIRCSAQERSNILDNAMGVFGLVDSQRIRMAADIIILLLYLVKHWNASSSGRVSSIAMHPLAALMLKFPCELSIDRLFVRAASS